MSRLHLPISERLLSSMPVGERAADRLNVSLWFGETDDWGTTARLTVDRLIAPLVPSATWVINPLVGALRRGRGSNHLADARNRQALCDGWSGMAALSLDVVLVDEMGTPRSVFVGRSRENDDLRYPLLSVSVPTALLSADTLFGLEDLMVELIAAAGSSSSGLVTGVCTVDRSPPTQTTYNMANGDIIRGKESWRSQVPGYQWGTVLGPSHQEMIADRLELANRVIPAGGGAVFVTVGDLVGTSQEDVDRSYDLLSPLLPPLRRPTPPVLSVPYKVATQQGAVLRPRDEPPVRLVAPRNDAEAALWRLNKSILIDDRAISTEGWTEWQELAIAAKSTP